MPSSPIEQLMNSGIVAINATTPPSQATIIVVGLARSGTSMVGAVLTGLGVFMGRHADRAVYEDTAIADALEKNAKELPKIIGEYNSAHNIWGFKRPMVFRTIKRHIHLFRKPRVIVTFRDPLAIALRNNISMGSELKHALVAASSSLVELASFVNNLEVPTLLVSYEKALSAPMIVTTSIAEFVGVNAAPRIAEASRAIGNAPELYLLSATRRDIRTAMGL